MKGGQCRGGDGKGGLMGAVGKYGGDGEVSEWRGETGRGQKGGGERGTEEGGFRRWI